MLITVTDTDLCSAKPEGTYFREDVLNLPVRTPFSSNGVLFTAWHIMTNKFLILPEPKPEAVIATKAACFEALAGRALPLNRVDQTVDFYEA
jgi:hypothetical protein